VNYREKVRFQTAFENIIRENLMSRSSPFETVEAKKLKIQWTVVYPAEKRHVCNCIPFTRHFEFIIIMCNAMTFSNVSVLKLCLIYS